MFPVVFSKPVRFHSKHLPSRKQCELVRALRSRLRVPAAPGAKDRMVETHLDVTFPNWFVKKLSNRQRRQTDPCVWENYILSSILGYLENSIPHLVKSSCSSHLVPELRNHKQAAQKAACSTPAVCLAVLEPHTQPWCDSMRQTRLLSVYRFKKSNFQELNKLLWMPRLLTPKPMLFLLVIN